MEDVRIVSHLSIETNVLEKDKSLAEVCSRKVHSREKQKRVTNALQATECVTQNKNRPTEAHMFSSLNMQTYT